MRKVTRREFLKQASAGVVSLALLASGCGSGTPGGADELERPDEPSVEEAIPTAVRSTEVPQATVASTREIAARATSTEKPQLPSATSTGEPEAAKATRVPPHLAVAQGADPAAITRAAIAALGGIERYVKPGDDVIVKPNICVDYHGPEYAATTNPDVVATLVRLCLGAGARRVRVMDSPFGGTAESAYVRSGIGEAVNAAGGEMEIMSPVKFVETDIPDGKDITSWKMYQDVIDADVLINVPIAKHHNLARLTLGGKNLMGVVLNRSGLHRNLGQRIADLVSRVRPTLTVVDAVRILTARGPSGGSLDDVQRMDTVIASRDIVAADAWAATLFGMSGADVPYIQAAADMGLGTLNLDEIEIEELDV
jgi:uncharacterized protein (DUF362 family)